MTGLQRRVLALYPSLRQATGRKGDSFMRLFMTALGLSMLLAGCGSPASEDRPAISLEFPADQGEASLPAAEAQCKPYGKTAQYRGVEQHGENKVAVFDCI
jgi:hypothetical protein